MGFLIFGLLQSSRHFGVPVQGWTDFDCAAGQSVRHEPRLSKEMKQNPDQYHQLNKIDYHADNMDVAKITYGS